MGDRRSGLITITPTMIMKALTMPSHLAATTKIMISTTATALRRMTTTTTSTRRLKKLWSRTTTITVTIVAVLMITLAIRFIVLYLTGMATIFMAQGMGMPTLAIMAILIMAMVMSHTAIITRTNTVEKTMAICTNMGAKTTDWKSTCMHMTLVTWSNMCPCMSRIST